MEEVERRVERPKKPDELLPVLKKMIRETDSVLEGQKPVMKKIVESKGTGREGIPTGVLFERDYGETRKRLENIARWRDLGNLKILLECYLQDKRERQARGD